MLSWSHSLCNLLKIIREVMANLSVAVSIHTVHCILDRHVKSLPFCWRGSEDQRRFLSLGLLLLNSLAQLWLFAIELTQFVKLKLNSLNLQTGFNFYSNGVSISNVKRSAMRISKYDWNQIALIIFDIHTHRL